MQHPLNNHCPVLHREVDPIIPGAKTINFAPFPFHNSKRRIRIAFFSKDVVLHAETVDKLKLLQRWDRRDLSGAYLVEDDLVHACILSLFPPPLQVQRKSFRNNRMANAFALSR